MTSIPLDFFMNNEELLKRHELAIPTNEMYRFFPPNEEILLIDSNPKKNYRYIFNGQQKTEYEQRKLNEYNEYELKQGKLNYPNNWLETDTMRLLQACEYDLEKTYKKIIDTINFMNSHRTSINNNIINLLNSGFVYVYGRDHHFRPIIIISIMDYAKLAEKNEYSFQDINDSIIYLMNYIIKYLLIPGQIENWVTIINFKGAGISDMSDFKKLSNILNSYRGRVFRNIIINVSGFLKMAVKTAVNLFGSNSARKLRILGSDELSKMQDIISPNNIQKKFGGLAPDIIPGGNNLFPPKMPSLNYELNGEQLNIISEEAYKEMCLNSNPYKPYSISPKYEEKWNQEIEQEKLKKKLELEEIQAKEIEQKKQQKALIENKLKEEENIRKLKIKENFKKIEEKEFVINFLKEFEELNMIDINEEKKYYSKPIINTDKINLFFNKIPKCRRMYLYKSQLFK